MVGGRGSFLSSLNNSVLARSGFSEIIRYGQPRKSYPPSVFLSMVLCHGSVSRFNCVAGVTTFQLMTEKFLQGGPR